MQTAYARMVYDRHQQRSQRADGGRARRTATFTHLLKDLCRRLVAFLFTQVTYGDTLHSAKMNIFLMFAAFPTADPVSWGRAAGWCVRSGGGL